VNVRAGADAAALALRLDHRLDSPRVAIVHDWLVARAGAERVLEQMLQLFPRADVFTLLDLLRENDRVFLNGAHVRTSFLQRLPVLRRRHRALLPFMPLAVEQFDLTGYDFILSSSHAVAKGVITGPDQLHLCYCHSPMRYAWDLQHQYLRESGLRGPPQWLARWSLHKLRAWDLRTANGVDAFMANSQFIAQRIRKTYRRAARVIHPPVDCDRFMLHADKEDFYLAASRMVPYKRMPLIARAFAAMPERRLVMIGDGPDMARVRSVATANIEVLGWQPDDVLLDFMQRARAFVFAAEEDFGIAPVEAQACGTPVIAFARGGVRETVLDGRTGLFFPAQSVEAITDAVHRFEHAAAQFCPFAIRRNAERFDASRFRARFAAFILACAQRRSAHPVPQALRRSSPAA